MWSVFYRRLLPVLLLGLLVTGCQSVERSCGVPNGGSPYQDPDAMRRGEIVHVPTGVKLNREQFFNLVADCRVLYLGESHDNIYDHQLELEVIRELERRHPGRLAVGMEMFGRRSQAEIDRWLAGDLSDEEFIGVFGRDWGVADYVYYRELLTFIKEKGIPLRALNVSRADRMARLQAAKAANGGRYPEMTDPYQRRALAAMFAGHPEGHGHQEMFDAMQLLWENTMADTIVDYLESPAGRQRQLVVVTGGFHVAYGFGIPRKVFARRPWSYAVVLTHTPDDLVENERRTMPVDFPSLPLYVADYLWCVPYRNLDDRQVRLGVGLHDGSRGVEIVSVEPGSAAAAAGLQVGDLLLRADGQRLRRSLDLQLLLLKKQVGDRCRLEVERQGQRLTLEAVCRGKKQGGR
ncbi:MAG: ChaN family lipoprotein [Deltaproteobacteria bacterium]|nr:ChaN family lipoprotein [Deltaproteobacteria bacterium]